MKKVGLIGCGFMGTMHANCYKNIDGVELVALADIRRENAEKLAEGTNASIYGDGYDLINNADVDIIDICLPTYLHSEYAIAAMDKVEKVYRYNSEMAAAIGDYQVFLESSDDYSEFRFDGIYEGRTPKYDNEIVISGNIKKHLEVELGEEIEVSCGACTEKFLIVDENGNADFEKISFNYSEYYGLRRVKK